MKDGYCQLHSLHKALSLNVPIVYQVHHPANRYLATGSKMFA
jgi:hypothetical protein